MLHCMLGEGDAAICPENQEWPFAAFSCAHFWDHDMGFMDDGSWACHMPVYVSEE